MKSITERPPILTVHEDSGDYILRVGDTRWRSLIVGVSKLLPDARRLIVVTPGDVKFFVIGDGNGGTKNNGDSVDGPILDIGGSDDDSDPQTVEEVTSQLPQSEEPEPSADAKPKLTRRRKPLRDDVQVGHQEKCQRCAGSGVTRTLMPDNSTAESMCPICQGDGTIKRYGARR